MTDTPIENRVLWRTYGGTVMVARKAGCCYQCAILFGLSSTDPIDGCKTDTSRVHPSCQRSFDQHRRQAT